MHKAGQNEPGNNATNQHRMRNANNVRLMLLEVPRFFDKRITVTGYLHGVKPLGCHVTVQSGVVLEADGRADLPQSQLLFLTSMTQYIQDSV